ncbi:MAG: peptidoglycan DD-metalloendopeptidase family protein [Hellea sp.]|nr:peptidoglycan DD-metalloendopeptidase family protein [Hellea sp.]
MFRFYIFIGALLAMPSLSTAQDIDPDKLEQISQAEKDQKAIELELSKKRNAINAEIKSIRSDLIGLSKNINDLENEQSNLSSQLTAMEFEEQNIRLNISQDRQSLSQLLSALQRIENNPPPPFLADPDDAASAARAGLLMQNLSAQLDQRVKKLVLQLDALDQIRAEIALKQKELADNQNTIQKRQQNLEGKAGEKNKLERSLTLDYEAAQARRMALAREAATLKELIDSLERSGNDIVPRIKPDPADPNINAPTATSSTPRMTQPVKLPPGALRFAKSKGKLYPPASGSVVQKYSTSHPGISIATTDRAQIAAPAAGRVEFAGAFKNYDNVVILNVDDGYFLLLTGLGTLYVQSEAEISAGEPVGLMPVNSSSGEKLYIEIRKNGSTIDPMPWFGTSFAKQN